MTDYLGTVRDLVYHNGSSVILAQHNELDAFGRLLSTPTIETLALYTGRFFDMVTGLQYNRARWYDASVGRWMSVDPIGFAAADANLYRYVSNQPTSLVDPKGLGQCTLEFVEKNTSTEKRHLVHKEGTLGALPWFFFVDEYYLVSVVNIAISANDSSTEVTISADGKALLTKVSKVYLLSGMRSRGFGPESTLLWETSTTLGSTRDAEVSTTVSITDADRPGCHCEMLAGDGDKIVRHGAASMSWGPWAWSRELSTAVLIDPVSESPWSDDGAGCEAKYKVVVANGFDGSYAIDGDIGHRVIKWMHSGAYGTNVGPSKLVTIRGVCAEGKGSPPSTPQPPATPEPPADPPSSAPRPGDRPQYPDVPWPIVPYLY